MNAHKHRFWFFASDLHGSAHKYEALFQAIHKDRPEIVLLGGDLLPHFGRFEGGSIDFLYDFLRPGLEKLRETLQNEYPSIFFIFGNDDPASKLEAALELENQSLWFHLHNKWISSGAYSVFGYACVPPTPFRLKDWEKYDVSRYVDPGCVPPSEGIHTTDIDETRLEHETIQQDLQNVGRDLDVSKSVFMFHSPPYKTNLDRAALDGKKIDHVPLDVHVGSMAIRKFIETRQPLLTLHGHIHESARIMGSWKDRIGSTSLFSAAHDGPELALVRFHPDSLDSAERSLI